MLIFYSYFVGRVVMKEYKQNTEVFELENTPIPNSIVGSTNVKVNIKVDENLTPNNKIPTENVEGSVFMTQISENTSLKKTL